MKFKSRWLTTDFHNSNYIRVNILPYLFTPSIAAMTAFKDTKGSSFSEFDFNGGCYLGRGGSEHWWAHAYYQV